MGLVQHVQRLIALKTGNQAIQQHRLRTVTRGSSRRSCLRLSFHNGGKHSLATSVSLSLRPEKVGYRQQAAPAVEGEAEGARERDSSPCCESVGSTNRGSPSPKRTSCRHLPALCVSKRMVLRRAGARNSCWAPVTSKAIRQLGDATAQNKIGPARDCNGCTSSCACGSGGLKDILTYKHQRIPPIAAVRTWNSLRLQPWKWLHPDLLRIAQAQVKQVIHVTGERLRR